MIAASTLLQVIAERRLHALDRVVGSVDRRRHPGVQIGVLAFDIGRDAVRVGRVSDRAAAAGIAVLDADDVIRVIGDRVPTVPRLDLQHGLVRLSAQRERVRVSDLRRADLVRDVGETVDQNRSDRIDSAGKLVVTLAGRPHVLGVAVGADDRVLREEIASDPVPVLVGNARRSVPRGPQADAVVEQLGRYGRRIVDPFGSHCVFFELRGVAAAAATAAIALVLTASCRSEQRGQCDRAHPSFRFHCVHVYLIFVR